jgi:uncharacterized protein (DUF1330 family)
MSAYVVMIRERITDAAELDRYKELAPAARGNHAITPLAFYGKLDQLEGAPADGVVILEFPSMAEARAWYDSPAYQTALAHRLRGAEYRVLIVDGVAPAAAA